MAMSPNQREFLEDLYEYHELDTADLDAMGFEEASDRITELRERRAALRAHRTAATAPTPHPHAHLPAIGTLVDTHRTIEAQVWPNWPTKCGGSYVVCEYVPNAPIVVARCTQCPEWFTYRA